MSKLYGWGAALVIVGALFKIQHYPGAGIMLTVGLGVEALIFFFSAFEKPHEEPDWTLVYPELAGIDTEEGKARDPRVPQGQITGGIQNITLSNNLDKLLDEANIGPELIENLGKGLRNLSDNASRLAEVSNAAIATQKYIQNMEVASQSVLELSQSYKNTNEYLKHDLSLAEEYANSLRNTLGSMNQLSETYKETAVTVKENLKSSVEYNESIKSITGYTNELAANYGKSSELLSKTVDALENSTMQGSRYTEQLQKSAQNLEALNAVYELQLQASDTYYQNTGKMQTAVGSLVENLNETVSSTEKYKEEMANLTRNIAALNNVYGNMLSAMNFNAPR
ncbi:MAG: gliding motility protein GldL [Bacteroidales bacterium]